ncbi:DUF1810 domain-containing protein [Massilia sp. GCM10020059]|uniref:DUF1810 domain-containing protein n=1 Tax=Massilia agrisoli TaxID=2892444 RepID=A0ABS8IVA1_9BURK|nr:DUF1810 domain-containing protein [Massilia agrisoli]MCC6071801.1 DUF1810 domain-containing protein [Massilia agrisoli]
MRSTFDLERFVRAQAPVYDAVSRELRSGRKRSHWMWFVFPQLAGLGRSEMAQRYALASLDEAAAYLTHPVLGDRLRQCATMVLATPDATVDEIFGHPDNMKFHSSMTLFAAIPGADPVFSQNLDKYFGGASDALTLSRLKE